MIEDKLKYNDDILLTIIVGMVFVAILIPLVCCWCIWTIIRIFYYIGCGVLDINPNESMKFNDHYTTSDEISYRLECDYKKSLYTPTSIPPEKPIYIKRGHISSP